MRKNALAPDISSAAATATYSAGHIGGNGMAVVGKMGWIRRRRPCRKRGRLKTGQETGNDASRTIPTRPSAQSRRPRLIVPRDNRAVFVQAHPLIDRERESVVLPRHLIFTRELNANRFACR